MAIEILSVLNCLPVENQDCQRLFPYKIGLLTPCFSFLYFSFYQVRYEEKKQLE